MESPVQRQLGSGEEGLAKIQPWLRSCERQMARTRDKEDWASEPDVQLITPEPTWQGVPRQRLPIDEVQHGAKLAKTGHQINLPVQNMALAGGWGELWGPIARDCWVTAFLEAKQQVLFWRAIWITCLCGCHLTLYRPVFCMVQAFRKRFH